MHDDQLKIYLNTLYREKEQTIQVLVRVYKKRNENADFIPSNGVSLICVALHCLFEERASDCGSDDIRQKEIGGHSLYFYYSTFFV